MVWRTVMPHGTLVAFVTVIIHRVQIVKEISLLVLLTMEHVVCFLPYYGART